MNDKNPGFTNDPSRPFLNAGLPPLKDDTDRPQQEGEAELEGATEQKAALLMATAKARGEFGKAFRDATGQFENRRFKYTPLHALEDASVPALAKHGLVLLQIPAGPRDGRYRLHNWLCHEGGAILKSTLSFAAPELNDRENKAAKQAGAVFTYMARYFVKTFWGLDGGEEDDIDRPEHDEPKGQRNDSQKAPAPRQEKRQPPAPAATKPAAEARQEPAKANGSAGGTASAKATVEPGGTASSESRQTELPGSAGTGMTDEQLGELKGKIRDLAVRLVPPLDSVESLAGYMEKLLKRPFEEVRNDPKALIAVHHALKLDVESVERRKAESSAGPDDPRTALMEEVHALGRKLGLPMGGSGRIVVSDLARYVYNNMGSAVLDDVKRDPAQIQKLIDCMKRQLEAQAAEFPHEHPASEGA